MVMLFLYIFISLGLSFNLLISDQYIQLCVIASVCACHRAREIRFDTVLLCSCIMLTPLELITAVDEDSGSQSCLAEISPATLCTILKDLLLYLKAGATFFWSVLDICTIRKGHELTALHIPILEGKKTKKAPVLVS